MIGCGSSARARAGREHLVDRLRSCDSSQNVRICGGGSCELARARERVAPA